MIHVHKIFTSKYLNKQIELGIVYACKCENVLVLLHGYGGSIHEVDKYFPLEKYAEEYSLMIVIPELGNQFYLDHKNIEGETDYIVSGFLKEELPEYLLSEYQIRPGMKLILGGYSMGGFGTILHGLNSRYDALISVCGAFVADEIAIGSDFVVGTDKKREFACNLFMIKEELPIEVLTDDPGRNTTAAVKCLTEEQVAQVPQIVIVSATLDVWHSTSVKLKRILAEKGISFISYEIEEGAHDFPEFDRGFRFAFSRIC